MSKSFSKPIIILIAVVSALILSSCTAAEQFTFFVTLGDAEAQTQTVEQAKAEWTYEDATLEQQSVIKYLQDQQNAYFMGIIASQQRPTDCISAMKQVFPSSSWSWATGIIMRESGNSPSADNPSSSAAGCLQLLKMHDHRYYAVGCTPAQKYDALCNIKAGYNLYQEAGTSPWQL